jgi:hypothetical protein
MERNFFRLAVVVGMTLLTTNTEWLWAATITAGSCSQSDVTNAIASASDGDRVYVPAGTCTWGQTVTVNKSISLIGAGIGQTIINGTDATTYGRGSALNWITKSSGNSPAGFSRLSGFTWQGTVGAKGYAGGTILSFRGNSKNFRFDHNRVEITKSGGIQTWDSVTGVMDHNELVNITASFAHLIQITHSNWEGTETSSCGPTTCGDTSWSQDHSIGTQNNWFIEDNEIENLMGPYGSYCSDDHMGSRSIYRFNLLTNCSLQMHGTETSGRERGGRYLVTYRNKFVWTLSNWASVIANRGGGGRHFDNIATGNLQRIADLNTYRRDDDYNSNHQGSYPFGRCGRTPVLSIVRSGSTATATFPPGSAGHYSNGGGSYQTFSGATQPEYNGTFLTYPTSDTTLSFTVSSSAATTATGNIVMVSPFDTPVDGYAGGYRCLDQAGAGKSIQYSGTGPAYSITIGPIASGQSALEPILAWGNTLNGALAHIVNPGLDVVVENRDMFNQNNSCAGGTCTGGIGRGASLPTGCSPTSMNSGPYFFDTDAGSWNAIGVDGAQDSTDTNGILYKCTAPNTWTVFWTPFTYPHPLVTGLTTASPPSAPTGLRVS